MREELEVEVERAGESGGGGRIWDVVEVELVLEILLKAEEEVGGTRVAEAAAAPRRATLNCSGGTCHVARWIYT